MQASESGWHSKAFGRKRMHAGRDFRHDARVPAYADWTMSDQQQDPKREEQPSREQGQADDRRRKDETEKLERDRADEAGRRSREGT
jgi:hypothetical protein